MASAEQRLRVVDTHSFIELVGGEYKEGIAEFKGTNSGFVTALVLPTGAVVPRFNWAECLNAHNFLPDLSQVNASGVGIPNSNFAGVLLVNEKTGRAFKIGNVDYSSFGSNRPLKDIKGVDLGSTDPKKVYGLAMASEKSLEKKKTIRTTYGDIGRFFVGQPAQQRQAPVRVDVSPVAAKKEEKEDSKEGVILRQPLSLLLSLSPHHTPKRSKRKAEGAGDRNVGSKAEEAKDNKSPTGSSPSRAVRSPEPEQKEQTRIKRSKPHENPVNDNVFVLVAEGKDEGELTLFRRRPRTPGGRIKQLHSELEQIQQAVPAPGMYDINFFDRHPSGAVGSSASSEPISFESAAPLSPSS